MLTYSSHTINNDYTKWLDAVDSSSYTINNSYDHEIKTLNDQFRILNKNLFILFYNQLDDNIKKRNISEKSFLLKLSNHFNTNIIFEHDLENLDLTCINNIKLHQNVFIKVNLSKHIVRFYEPDSELFKIHIKTNMDDIIKTIKQAIFETQVNI